MSGWVRMASLRTPEALRAHLAKARIPLDFDDRLASPDASPMAQPIEADGLLAGNRYCILPMEGWDGTRQGEPTELTTRRWKNFGKSGAKLIWGGEAAAVSETGRANPHQVMMTPRTWEGVARLREALVAAHVESFGRDGADDLVVGLQLTHSGRYARPDEWGQPAPMVPSHHPVLDGRFPGGVRVISDDELDSLADAYVQAARLAHRAGFGFVDVKHCHGYLGHELLGARHREGRYGGSFENRTRLLRTVVERIRDEAPGLRVAVRFSAFDTVPFKKNDQGIGAPEDTAQGYDHGFGLLRDDSALDEALEDAREFLRLLRALEVRWVCVTAGSPYYNPHVQRPALFPPSDGYDPPEDPLVGVARQIRATARLKQEFPDLVIVGSAYSYLQEWLPHVAQRVVADGDVDLVGLGRMVLSYPELPADVLAGRDLAQRRLCRTFSDCTTAPRNAMVSGCYPLDPFYIDRPEAKELKAAKARASA